MGKKMMILISVFLFLNFNVFAKVQALDASPPMPDIAMTNGNILPPLPEENKNIIVKNNKQNSGTDTNLNCPPWTRCIDNKKTRKCYNAKKNEYVNQTMKCSLHCSDHKLNFDETDVDCGGSCSPCKDGKKCNDDSDCFNLCNNVCFSLKRSDIIKVPSKDRNVENYNYLWYAILIPIFIFFLFWFRETFLNQPKNKKVHKDKMDIKKILELIKETELLISQGRISEAKEKYKIIIRGYDALSIDDKKMVEHKIADLYYDLNFDNLIW